MADLQQNITVEFIEKESVEVELEETSIIDVNFTLIDKIAKTIDVSDIVNYFIIETPTKVTSKKFTTAYSFYSDTLMVFLNGIKELADNITIIDNNTFELPIDSVEDDIVEVIYFKRT